MKTKQNNLVIVTANIRKSCVTVTPPSERALPLFDETHRLKEALADTPEVRAEKVARGKALIADSNYPSQEQMKKVAGVLAANWNSCDSQIASSARHQSTGAKRLAKAMISTCA